MILVIEYDGMKLYYLFFIFWYIYLIILVFELIEF